MKADQRAGIFAPIAVVRFIRSLICTLIWSASPLEHSPTQRFHARRVPFGHKANIPGSGYQAISRSSHNDRC